MCPTFEDEGGDITCYILPRVNDPKYWDVDCFFLLARSRNGILVEKDSVVVVVVVVVV
jgi:hypothetical protein